jgi:Transposase IS66 family
MLPARADELIEQGSAEIRKPTQLTPWRYVEAVERIDALFAIEREINGLAPDERQRARNERSRPLVAASRDWGQRSGL